MEPDHLTVGLVTWLARTVETDPPIPSAAVRIAAENPDGSMWLYLLGGGSLVTVLGMIGKWVNEWRTGRAAEKVRRSADLVLQRDTAWDERDKEASKRARALRNLDAMRDYAGQLRYLCRIHGVPTQDIPTYPAMEHDPPDPPDK